MDSKLKQRHIFVVNPDFNGGESVIIETKFIANGDPITTKNGIFVNQEISLHCYANEAVIKLFGCSLTPEKLRDLANQLEQIRNSITQ